MICTCDNCHYTFAADSLPAWCPECHKETRNHKVAGKIISAPCVRTATEDETIWYEKAVSEERNVKELAEKLRVLGEPYFRNEHENDVEDTENSMLGYSYPADPYHLPIHEHNFALMIIYYLQVFGKFYGKLDLEKMLMGEDVDEKVDLYKKVKTTFNRGINTEQRNIEKPGKLTREVWEAATPALKTLYSFRQDDDINMLLGEVPNRGNIQRIDLKKLAEEPSEGFIQFLRELYNGMKE